MNRDDEAERPGRVCQGCGQPIRDEPASIDITDHLLPVAHAACRLAVGVLLSGLLDL